MRKALCNFCAIIIVLGLGIFCFVPNPFLTDNFTKSQWQILNDFHEVEELSASIPESKSAVILEWQNCIDVMWKPFVDTQVFDLESQQTFCVQRTGGLLHADIEPKTQTDTQIFANIVTNCQKPRLAVLVNLGGVWVAGSLSTKPHGYGLITNNNLNGHLCLHFFKSKTSSTKKEDPLHQKTIKKALKLSRKNFPKN